MSRMLTNIALCLAAIVTAISAVAAVRISASAKTTSAPAAPPPLSDYWEQDMTNTLLTPSAQEPVTILTMQLPPGQWILQAEQSVYDTGQIDFVTCSISDGGAPLNAHRVFVGDSRVPGKFAGYSASELTVASETAAVTLTTTTVIEVACSHDNATTTKGPPRIDAGASLWAHQSAHLTIRQVR